MDTMKYIRKRISKINSKATKELDGQKTKLDILKKQADEYEKVFREALKKKEAEEDFGKDR